MKTVHPSVYRASILHFLSDPAQDGDASYEYFEDGALVIDEGKVVALGDAEPMIRDLDHPAKLVDLSGHLITPGFIDPHLHFPQIGVIASYGEELLDWLQRYTFPAESRFKDPRYALQMAELFLDELLRNGTTTAGVYGSVHNASVEAFFEVSSNLNTRMVCGKVLMDRNAPSELCEPYDSSYQACKTLIERWHNEGRQQFAITPRFAVTSTPEQLDSAGTLSKEYPDLLVQSHLSENQAEIELVTKLFPDAKDYLDVYDRFGLVGTRSIFAHGIHLGEREYQRLSNSGAGIAFCPSSNLSLGSGLMDISKLDQHSVRFGIASDVGGGSSFSMLKTLHDGYKVSQLRHQKLDPLRSFYLATLGNARLMHLENQVGSFRVGNEADFLVLDLNATPLMRLRQALCDTLEEKLFALIALGDERHISRTYIAGKLYSP